MPCSLLKPFVLTSLIAFLAALMPAGAASAEARVLHEFRAGRDFAGPMQRALVDRKGLAWLATPRQLFVIQRGRPQLVATGAPGARLALAPGGDRFAWLVHGFAPFGRFSVEIFDLNRPSTLLAKLEAASAPADFSTIHVGNLGELFVTETPLQNPEGLHGEFHHGFWSSEGQYLGSATRDGAHIASVDESGEAILLIGPEDAQAYDRKGVQSWRIVGRYRKGVSGAGARTILLNPAREIGELHVAIAGNVTKLRMPGAIHELAITPDGTIGAVATSGGRLSTVDLNSCNLRTCRIRHLPPLPINGSYIVSAVRFLDHETLVVGIVQYIGRAPSARYYGGAVLVVNAKGEVRFRKNIDISQPPTVGPLLDVTFGARAFAAYTRDEAIFVQVEDRP